jgi:DNA-binding HxlR family transcriptional regulator
MKAMHTTCPVTKTARLLSDTWTILIGREVLDGPRRFCELERALPGISTRTLSLKLQKLESEGMLRKQKDGTYAVTAKGKGLKLIENAMRRFGERFL